MVGFGANLGDPAATFRSVATEIAALGDVIAVSNQYRTRPIGPPGQPDYRNGVLELHTALAPEPLLRGLQAIEHRHGRVRGVRWGARTLDLDLVWYEGAQSDDPALTLPHPRAHEREFVLRPLCDLDPSLRLGDRTAAEWLAGLAPQGVEQVDGGAPGA